MITDVRIVYVFELTPLYPTCSLVIAIFTGCHRHAQGIDEIHV